jgi:hypothetical protein
MKMKSPVLVLAISLEFFVGITAEASTIKAGTTCTKLNQKITSAGYTYTCIKSGKKLVWSKGVKAVSPAPMPSPNPTPNSSFSPEPIPSPSATFSPTPSSTTTINSDYLSFKRAMIYATSGSLLTRQAASGIFFTTDSRPESSFDPIRVRAYNELNLTPTNTSHPNIKIEYDISATYPKSLVDFCKLQVEEAAGLWNNFFASNTKVFVHFVTEQDREAIKSNRWLQLNLPATFDRFDLKKERPFISGGGGYWPHNDGTYAELFLATASYLDLNYVNYEWPQVAKHEFAHIAEDYGFYKNGKVRPNTDAEFDLMQPLNFREGSANTIGYLTAFPNLGWASDALDWRLWQTKQDSTSWNSLTTLTDVRSAVELTATHSSTSAFDASYAIGALMYEWLIGTYGLPAYINLLTQLETPASFDDDLKSAIGLTKDEFYTQTSAYIYKNLQRIGA